MRVVRDWHSAVPRGRAAWPDIDIFPMTVRQTDGGRSIVPQLTRLGKIRLMAFSCSGGHAQRRRGAVQIVYDVAGILVIVGALNWALVGLLKFDLVALIAGGLKFGEVNVISRIIYVIVGISAIVAVLADEAVGVLT